MSSGQRVVIIDDDQWLVDSYERTLQTAGYIAQHAENTLQAISLIDSFKPHVIILDLFMPGPNGIVLLHELRSHSDLARIPVVLISNAAGDLQADALQAYGVVQVLDKTTMQPGDVLAAVKKVLP